MLTNGSNWDWYSPENPRVTSPNLDKKSGLGIAGIAQLVEQRTENPRVTSSNLVLGT